MSVLGRDEGYTVKYNPLPEGVPEGTPEGKRLYLTVYPGHYIILTIIRLMLTSLFSLKIGPYTP